MKNRMMSVKTDKEFEFYCCQLQEITNKLDEIQWLVKKQNTISVKHPMLASYSNSASQSPITVKSDMMNWKSSKQRNKNTQQRQAKWIDDKEYQQQRFKEVCLCCGSAVHQIHICLFLSVHWSQTSTQLYITETKIVDLFDAMLEKENEHEILMLRKE